MHSKYHIFYSTLFIILCYLLIEISPFQLLVIWFSSWLIIDLDHAIRYSVITKNLNPIKFWKWSKQKGEIWNRLSKKQKQTYKKPIFIFHGIEALIIFLILSLKFQFFLFIFIGFLFHLLLDEIDLIYRKDNPLTKISLIYVVISNQISPKKRFNL